MAAVAWLGANPAGVSPEEFNRLLLSTVLLPGFPSRFRRHGYAAIAIGRIHIYVNQGI